MNKKILALISAGIISLSLVGCSSETGGNDTEQSKQELKDGYTIKYGELLENNINEDILVVKAKIKPNMTNKLTISQNGFNVEDLIKNQGADEFKEIQYWAVADMTSGEESKVISFTVDEDLIKSIKEGNTVANQIVDKAKDVWILPSLQE